MASRVPTVLDVEEFNFIPPERKERRRALILRKIEEVFSSFERENSRSCDVREVGTIIRAMGINPTEAEVLGIIETVEEAQSTGFIQFDKLKTVLVDILLTNEFKGQLMVRDSEETIVKAFELLDRDKKGYIEAEYLREIITTMGERFNNDEMLEFINSAADPETGFIYYEDYAAVLATE